MVRAQAFIVASIVALSACGEGFTSEEGQGGSSTSSGTGTGTGTTSSGVGGSFIDCPEDSLWAPPLDPNWQGPFLLARSDQEAALPDCLEGGLAVLHLGLVGNEPAVCNCSCGAPESAACEVDVGFWSDPSTTCGGSAPAARSLLPGCTNVSGLANVGGLKWLSVPPQDGACMVTSGQSQGVPNWTSHMQLCNAVPTLVEGEMCVPTDSDFDASACIVQQGTSTCPAGYPSQRVGFTGFSDDRGCSPCSCDSSTASCGGHVIAFTSGACEVADGGNTAGPALCLLLGGSTVTALTYEPEASGTCAAGGGQSQGSAEGTGAYTVCCTL
jgi:hypothetical protein